MQTKLAITIMLALIILSTLGGILLMPQLPPQMASHWNAADQVDGTMSRFWGVFLMPLITLFMMVLFLIIPTIDPMAENIKRFRGTFNTFIVLTVGFMVYIYWLTLLYNLGYSFALSQLMLPALGVLFFAAGSLVEKAQPNWFIGIRTPWTLSNPVVWEKTHHLGGILFKVAGGLTFLSVLAGKEAFWVCITTIMIAALVPTIYSYLLFQNLQRGRDNPKRTK